MLNGKLLLAAIDRHRKLAAEEAAARFAYYEAQARFFARLDKSGKRWVAQSELRAMRPTRRVWEAARKNLRSNYREIYRALGFHLNLSDVAD